MGIRRTTATAIEGCCVENAPSQLEIIRNPQTYYYNYSNRRRHAQPYFEGWKSLGCAHLLVREEQCSIPRERRVARVDLQLSLLDLSVNRLTLQWLFSSR